MQKLTLSIFIITNLFSNTFSIQTLQSEFIKNVIETNIFRSRYEKYLNNKCEDNFECFQNYINYLKKWDTVQNDQTLWSFYQQKSALFYYNKEYWDKLEQKLMNKKLPLEESQFVSVVDLENQLFIVTIWDKDDEKFHFIGKDYISSGDIKRESEITFGEDHYLKTPSGVFKTQKGWRSDGKYNEDNSTLGYGYKDRFVFYFGKHKTIRYNIFDKDGKKIEDIDKWQLITDNLNFALHAHKSTKPMGEPYSHGCIRMTDELNRFIDNNLILHKNMLDGDKWLDKQTKKPEQPKNFNLAGEYLIIFDKI